MHILPRFFCCPEIISSPCLFYLWIFKKMLGPELIFLICISNAIIHVFMCFYKYFTWASGTCLSSLYDSQRKLFYSQHTMHEVIANMTTVIKCLLDQKQKKKVYGYSLIYDLRLAKEIFVELGKRRDKLYWVPAETYHRWCQF